MCCRGYAKDITELSTCDVCYLVDRDERTKPVRWCNQCQAFICEACVTRPMRRLMAAVARRFGFQWGWKGPLPLVLALALLVPMHARAQTGCAAGLQNLTVLNATDNKNVVWQNACWNAATHTLTFPNTSSSASYSWFGNTANPLTAMIDPTQIQDANGSFILFDTNFGQPEIAISAAGDIDIDTAGDFSNTASTMEWTCPGGCTFENNVTAPQIGDTSGDVCTFASGTGITCTDVAGDSIQINNGQVVITNSTTSSSCQFPNETNGFIDCSASNAFIGGGYLEESTTATKFTISGCGGSTVGGGTAGRYSSTTTGVCTTVVTMGNSLTSAHAWACSVFDLSSASAGMRESASNQTSATFTGTTTSGDSIVFNCMGV